LDLGERFFVSRAIFSPDGRNLAIGGGPEDNPGDVRIYSADEFKLIATLKGHKDRVLSLAYSPDGRVLISGGRDGQCVIWNTAKTQLIGALKSHNEKDSIWGLAISPDGKQVASAGGDNTVILWDVASRKSTATVVSTSNKKILSLAYSPDGRALIGGGDRAITVWDTKTRKEEKELKGHSEPVVALAFTPNGRYLISCSRDGAIKIWETATWSEEGGTEQGKTAPLSLAVSPDSRSLAVACWSGEVMFYNLSKEVGTNRLRKDLVWTQLGFRAHDLPVTTVAYRSDGKMLVSGSIDGTVKIWSDPP
jgi:WD40 repeat protein